MCGTSFVCRRRHVILLVLTTVCQRYVCLCVYVCVCERERGETKGYMYMVQMKRRVRERSGEERGLL